MADVKNFGLVGVGSSLQFSKGGAKLVNNAGTFNFKAANGTADTAVTASALTATTGNLAATLGNLTLSATGATITVGTDTVLSRQQAGVFQFNGTRAVVAPVGATSARPSAAIGGMIRVNSDVTSAETVEFYNGTAWKTLADTSTTSGLQTEVDNIETSLGSAIKSDGTFNGFTNVTGVLVDATSFTDAIDQIASAVKTDNSLDEIFPSVHYGNVIYSNGSNVWAQAAPGATSGVQAYSTSLAALAAKSSTGFLVQTGADTYGSASFAAAGGLTVTGADGTTGTTTFGTTGNLAALNSMSTSGLAVRNTDGTWVNRSVTSNNSGITVTNADGTAGNITLDVAGNLAQVSGLTTVGFLVRHTDGTTSTESITGSAGRIVVTSGNGDTVSPTVDLDTVTQASSGNFVKVTLDGYGRVTGNTAVTTSDVTALVDSRYLRLDGTTPMTGALNAGGQLISNVAAPVSATDAANKAYVDNAVSGLTWKDAVEALLTVQTALTGVPSGLAVGNRVLLTGQTAPAENGIYVVATGAWTRSTDAATPGELSGAAVFVTGGTYANTGWTQTVDPLTDFAAQTWVQFSGAGAYTGSGAVSVSGTTISIVTGNGLTQTGNTLSVTAAGAITVASGDVALTLDTTATGGLDQTGGALRIKAGSVTNAMLASSLITLNADSGTGGVDLGNTLTIKGTSGQGISVAVSSTDPATYVVTATNASSSQKGVATFNSASFATTTSGDVTIKAGGVTNTQLVNSSFSVTGTTGSDTVALGGTFAITSADSALTTTASSSGVAIQLNTVDVAHGGTGVTALTANQVIYGNGTSPVAQSANFTFDGTSTLTVGGALPLAIDGATGSITATATNSDLVLMPNGTGSVIVGPVGAGLIQSDAATALTVQGNTTLTLVSGTGSTTMQLASGTSNKVSVSGPTAADYATGLAANDLTNKQYVDTAIASGASAGAIKSFMATVPLNASGTTNIGTAMPAGATVLSVKVRVDTVDTDATLTVGKSGSTAAYMTDTENDPQSQGLYVAECFVTESTSTQLIATVAGATIPAGSGSCVVIVTYQVAQ